MDDFAVDLDKVLDDFELSEGERAIQHDQHRHTKKDDGLDLTDPEQPHAATTATEKENNSCVPSFYDIPYDTHNILDVVDGDFGSKGLSSDLQPNINTTDGGYFVPEGASDSADDADDQMPGMLNGPAVNMFCYEGQPVGHVGSGLSAFSVYDKHRNVDMVPAEFVPDNHVTPELLHNAFDAVGLADPDSDTEPTMRPSFMSSSPPNAMALGGISQPDVVPAMMDAQLNVSLPCCELADDLQQPVTMSCSRDDTVHTSVVSEGQTMMTEETVTDSPHSSMVMSRSDSGELEKDISVTNEGRVPCDDAKEYADSANVEDSTVETSGSDTADIIMDIQGAQQTSSGSSVSLPDVSSLSHPGSGNAEPMNVSVADKISPVGFDTIETDDAGDATMENRLAEMGADVTCHKSKDITAPVAESESMESHPAVVPCNCDVQSEQDAGGVDVEQGADVEEDAELPRETVSGGYVEESSEQTHVVSSPQKADTGTASVSECLTLPGESQDSQGRCDLGDTVPMQSAPDTNVTATATGENSADVLTSSSNDDSSVTPQCDNSSVVPGPVVGMEGDTTTTTTEQDMGTTERTGECDIADKTTHPHTDNTDTVHDNKVDTSSCATHPPPVMSQSMPMQGVGARPKEHVVRRNRPNSLLGLSKPDVGPVAVEKPVGGEKTGVLGGMVMGAPMSGIGGGIMSPPVPGFGGGVVIENSHDLINMQLAQHRARSPLEKQQLNLEIRQHQLGSSDTSGPVETLDNKLLDNRSVDDAVPQCDTMTQVGPETTSPALPHPNVVRSAKPPCSLDVSSSYSPAPSGDDVVPQQGVVPQQRRPCSLTLPPRGDYQQEGHSVPDVDAQMVSDSPTATGDHVTPNTTAVATEAIPPSPSPGLVAPPSSINPNLPITELGKMAPVWLPDAEAPNCMQCEAKFTFTRRRHHCRCCGKVFCSGCCNLKIALAYLEEKEARVCSCCYQDLIRAQVYEKHHSAAAVSSRPSPNPNNPCEYCSTVPPLQQAQGHTPALPPTVMVPVGVLRKQGLQKKGEPKQVIFSDGIRPGGDLTELDAPSQPQLPVQKTAGRKAKKLEKTKQNDKTSPKNSKQQNSNKNRCLIPTNGLPPVILPTGVKGDFSLEENPQPETFMPQIRSIEDPSPVAFAINKNLFVMVKIVNLDCCVNRVCLCFSTKGMCTVAQDEIVIILQCLPDEKTVPRDIFVHLFNVYDNASKGNTVANLDHSIFTENILGSKDYGGFLYIRPSFQCLHKLLLPQPPYVIGILLQKWEIPWAKVFPVRLMLRLGAEYRYYPCPLISVRERKPVYGEIGHTIMNLLADFRNYQYQLMCVRGLVVHMEEKRTYINLPRNRYNEVMKVISNSNDYVMAFGANFSQQADSHLVCIQNDDGNYQTQAINIQNKPRKVTGASFVVFNGALKASSGLRAKSSIVEDGLMVQVMAETMSELKQALHAMKDYTIGCGSLQTPEPEECVVVQWVEDDRNVNVGVKSPIDDKTMDGIQSIRIHSAMDCVGDHRTIRWTEVFFIENEDRGTSRCEPVDLSRLAETLARACCLALVSHLDLLKDAGLTRLALRATIDSERVGYEVGANGSQLPPFYMNSLDSELIPVIHSAASSNQEGPIVLELIFHIIE